MASRDSERLRQGLNPLNTTALGPASSFTAHINTPVSAISMSSSHIQSAHSPASAHQPYNPQEWIPSTATSREGQATARPPPPYSPPRSQQQRPGSGLFDQTVASGSTPPPHRTMASSTSIHQRSSPDSHGNAAAFPPPPGAGGRGNSRERRFGIPSFGRRRDTDRSEGEPQGNARDIQHSSLLARRSMGPMAFNSLESENTSTFVSSPLSQGGPPAARRAVSAGAVETPTSGCSRSSSRTRWEPGMPVPPPPPGPPPPSSRSQSVQPMDRNTVPIISAPIRRPPSGGTSLGPVPPTPAGWVDSDSQQLQIARDRSPALTIDTATANDPLQAIEPPMPSSSSAGGLSRARAVRHDKTISQRRAESRHRQAERGSIDESANSRVLSDIVVPSSSGIAGHLLGNRSTQRTETDTPGTGDSAGPHGSRNSTPRALGSASLPQPVTDTPPASASTGKQVQRQTSNGPPSLVPKALPTPPPQARSASSTRPREASRPPSATTPMSKHLVVTQSAEQFALATVERCQAFASQESLAATDADRVRLFADFLVSESRIRRERYSSAISAMGSEVLDLTRDLFRPLSSSRRGSGASQEIWTPESSDLTRSHRGSLSSFGAPNSAPTSANLPSSPSAPNPPLNWNMNYMPSLSPILSMSVSDNLENGSSRGRTPSRWWESDSHGDPSRRLERSKRESKYMGVPKNQWEGGQDSSAGPASTNEQPHPLEYPPEKVGWHEKEESQLEVGSEMANPSSRGNPSPSPAPSCDGHLDVSRLVTLPPPYPRHHPAVNNNHPELTSIRASVRALSDLSEVERTKELFANDSSMRRSECAQAASEYRQEIRENLQREVSEGSLRYGDAAAIEKDAETAEKEKTKDLEKREYELFQSQVVLPMHNLLTGRIARAIELFESLSRHLFDNGQNDADMPQEEGDDRPELLEKLTLLKWIFEARESLHKATYDLLSDRNRQYREVVLTPYRLSGNKEKIQSAEAFFADDAAKREHNYANEVLDRAREFRNAVDKAVERGVTLQLSAFWDIAPPLRDLLDAIPAHVQGFGVQVPMKEIEENPSYLDHPLQYLFSLLLHAEKSTYQFIEAHTNLLCLLHEAKEAVVHAKARVLETQVLEADGTPMCSEERGVRAAQMRQTEEQRLTDDLKEKVRVGQEQWQSALGESLGSVKERTREYLLETAGWDETLEEGIFDGA